MRLSFGFLVAACLGSCLIPAIANAQQAIALPGIYVEGASMAARPIRATETPPSAAEAPAADPVDTSGGIPLDRIGSAVTIITGQDLERQRIRNGADALRSLPGVSVSQSGGPGNITAVRIRGAESRHTLVVIDGVEVNSATDGTFDFSNLSTADIERIEVLRGPQSALYGSGAVGGVVNVTTKSGRGPLSLVVTNEIGTQRSAGTIAQLSGGTDKVWGSLVVQRRQTEGFNISVAGDEADGSRVNSFAFRGGVALSSNFKIETTLREHNTRSEFDDGNGIFRGFSVPSDAPSVSDARLRVGSLQATLEAFDKSWVQKFYVNGTETVRDDASSFGLSQTTGTNEKIGHASTFRFGENASPVQHFITGLFERRVEAFEQISTDPTLGSPRRKIERNSVAGEIRGEYFRNLFVTASLRHDTNDAFENFTTWNINASLKIPGTVFRLHSAVGTGVKYPSLADLFGTFAFFVPNPNLVPEESFGHDFGVEAALWGGRAVLDVTYFKANLTNEIAFASTGLFTLTNLPGDSTRDGVEVAARYLMAPGLTIGGAYTFLLAEESTGLQEIRRPRHSGRADLNYAFGSGRGNVNIAAIYNGSMRDLGFFPFPPGGSDRVGLDSYWLVNVAAAYKLQPGVEVFGRVENLLDEHYQEVFGFNATPGIAAFAGIKLTFGGREGVGGTWDK